jgi:hypothetical protein
VIGGPPFAVGGCQLTVISAVPLTTAPTLSGTPGTRCGSVVTVVVVARVVVVTGKVVVARVVVVAGNVDVVVAGAVVVVVEVVVDVVEVVT